MNSKKKEKKSLSYHLISFLIIFFSILGLKLIFGLIIKNPLFEWVLIIVILFPISCYFYFKDFYQKELPASTKKEVDFECPYHPDEKKLLNCEICNTSICERCQTFKTEMKEYYQHNFRLNHHLFEKNHCLNCIFQKMDTGIKIILISSPIFFGLGAGFLLFGSYVVIALNKILIVVGILMMVLSIILFIFSFILNKERKRIFLKFTDSAIS